MRCLQISFRIVFKRKKFYLKNIIAESTGLIKLADWKWLQKKLNFKLRINDYLYKIIDICKNNVIFNLAADKTRTTFEQLVCKFYFY